MRDLEGHLKEKGVGVVLKPFDIDDLLRRVDAAWREIARPNVDAPIDAAHPQETIERNGSTPTAASTPTADR